jgi:CheY-like chemotaxis protein
MSSRELKSIFHPFKQAESAQYIKAEGTGLGLAISKRLWELLDGKIEVKSKKDSGSTFTLILPIVEATADQKRSAVKRRTTREKQTVRTKRKAKILIIDDNLDNQYAVKYILEDRGFNVDFADNGTTGVNKARRIRPNLILLDMKMPGLDGYQAVRQIRSNGDLKQVPVIAMTALTPQEDKGKAKKAGCDDYLVKPFTLEQITEKIEQWLG